MSKTLSWLFIIIVCQLLFINCESASTVDNVKTIDECQNFPGNWYGYYSFTLEQNQLLRVYQTTVNLFNSQTSSVIMKVVKPINSWNGDWIFYGSCSDGELILNGDFVRW